MEISEVTNSPKTSPKHGPEGATSTQQTMKGDGNQAITEDRSRERDKVTFGIDKGKKPLMEGVTAQRLDRILPPLLGMQVPPTNLERKLPFFRDNDRNRDTGKMSEIAFIYEN